MSIERIDPELCNGCGICVTTCPVDVIRLDPLANRRGEYPGCRRACPAEVDMRRYLYLVREGLVEEALGVLRESLPLPAVTGMVCHHPCESGCSRNEVDEAVNINALERYVADSGLYEKAQRSPQIYSARIAVIGSGPAGLSCAYFLANKGYPVTVFEAMPVLGGMLRVGIPEYRLPRDVLDIQIAYIKDMGVEFKTELAVGRDITLEALRNEYSAIFFGTGHPLSRKVEIEGSDLRGVMWGMDFLKEINLGKRTEVKGKVVVIGGGNVAITAALTALRSGAEDVQLACLETSQEMPAFKEEVDLAVAEGVTILPGWGPKRILSKDGKLTEIELVRCKEILNDETIFQPCYDVSELKTVKVNMVILAVGQAPDLSLLPEGLNLTPRKTIKIDPVTLETDLAGIFAGGDAVSGPASVVEAIGAGKNASISIDRYLRKEDLKAGRNLRCPERVKNPPKAGMEIMARQREKLLPIEERVGNYKEIRIAFDVDTANLESQRCMTCGSLATIQYAEDCMLCLFCERDCPQKAIYVSPVKKINPMMAWA